ncbi:MAG TPA: cytochrome c oxidase subunit 3 family protein [Terriglobales bacterium]|nr:cytochrome c oxidase subunit 3 family protein [Terriglobales bacterium]
MQNSPAVDGQANLSVEHLEHVHNPALLHHFADAQQQKNAASLGMWLFLVTEIMFFGGMFCAYLIYRLAHFNAFAAGSQQLSIKLGAFNTAVLIISSVTVVLAVKAAEAGKRKLLVSYLVVTVLLGLTFLVVKGFEYREKFEKHHVPGSTFNFTDTFDDNGQKIPVNSKEAELFFSIYFVMTGMHALHMIIGCGLFTGLAILAWKGRYSPAYFTPIENGGLYWHLVDIIWIYLFPLLYLISRHS